MLVSLVPGSLCFIQKEKTNPLLVVEMSGFLWCEALHIKYITAQFIDLLWPKGV